MKFEAFGPYEIPRNDRFVSGSRRDHRPFWDKVEHDCEGLSSACGCYVLVIRSRAWYVGLAERQSFNPECFTSHKVLQYNAALQRVAGPPSLLFVAKVTPNDRFAKPSVNGHRDIQFLENLLIGWALRRNRDLQNIRGTKLLREMNVPGILNTEQGRARALPVQALKEALGI